MVLRAEGTQVILATGLSTNASDAPGFAVTLLAMEKTGRPAEDHPGRYRLRQRPGRPVGRCRRFLCRRPRGAPPDERLVPPAAFCRAGASCVTQQAIYTPQRQTLPASAIPSAWIAWSGA